MRRTKRKNYTVKQNRIKQSVGSRAVSYTHLTMSHIHLVKDDMLGEYNWKGNINLINIILIGITNELPAVDKKYELHRLISTLLSNQLKPNEKFEIIEKEYGIPLTEDLRKDVNVMCNLSQGIVDDTEMKIVINMYKNNFTLEPVSYTHLD